MKWSEFRAAAPEIGALAQEAFDEQHLAILGTLRSDGWPRVSPCEVYFVETEMLLGMMFESAKALDLRRDSRITVVNGQENRIPRLGDAKLYGHAREITDESLRSRFADAQEEAIDWRPMQFNLFAVDIDRASYISFGEGRRLLHWSADRDEEELRHPEEAQS
jgi:hypothetical protein